MSAYINRCDDYRGDNPQYRAGSILGYGGCRSCQTAVMDTYYEGSTGDLFTNAGSFGSTTPISAVRLDLDGIETPPRWRGGAVGIPSRDPGEGTTTDPRRSGGDIPSVQELLNQPRGTMSSPSAIPLVPPPVKPRVTPPSSEDPSIETQPFSPNDEVIVPQDTFPVIRDEDPPITLEELRRLDPSVKDLQIISIEDAGLETLVR